jgi:hypothetical protein
MNKCIPEMQKQHLSLSRAKQWRFECSLQVPSCLIPKFTFLFAAVYKIKKNVKKQTNCTVNHQNENFYPYWCSKILSNNLNNSSGVGDLRALNTHRKYISN